MRRLGSTLPPASSLRHKPKMSMKKLIAGLMGALAILLSQSAWAQFHVVDDVAFYKVTEVQKTASWCWAASIAMSLSAQGVKWRQEDVVAFTKGGVIDQTASAREMSYFLNSWNHLDYQGQRWSVSSTHYQGAAPLDVLISSIDSRRPLIATYRTGPRSEHAVVIYAVNVLDDDTRLHSVYFFDPYTGKKGAANARDFRQNTTHTWDVTVDK